MPTVEERLHSAAALLDETLDQRKRSLPTGHPPGRGSVESIPACVGRLGGGLFDCGPGWSRRDRQTECWNPHPRYSVHAARRYDSRRLGGIFPSFPSSSASSTQPWQPTTASSWGGCCEPDTRDDPDSTSFHDGAYFDIHDGTCVLQLPRWPTPVAMPSQRGPGPRSSW